MELLHTPRGNKGVWVPVQAGEKIRVTKGKAKRLRLRVGCPEDFRVLCEVHTLDVDNELSGRCRTGEKSVAGFSHSVSVVWVALFFCLVRSHPKAQQQQHSHRKRWKTDFSM